MNDPITIPREAIKRTARAVLAQARSRIEPDSPGARALSTVSRMLHDYLTACQGQTATIDALDETIWALNDRLKREPGLDSLGYAVRAAQAVREMVDVTH